MVIVCLYRHPVLVLLVLQITFLANAVFLIYYRPFEKKAISYMAGISEMMIFIVLVLILIIHSVMGSYGQTQISQAAIRKSV